MPPIIFIGPSPTPAALVTLPPGASLIKAEEFMEAGEFESAILHINDILNVDPENIEAYRRRARCYIELAKAHSLRGPGTDHIRQAIADLDRAIALAPHANGDDHLSRYEAYHLLAASATYRAEIYELSEAALQNLRVGISLYNNEPTARWSLPILLGRLGRCDESIEEALKLIAARGWGAAPHGFLYGILGDAHMCNGDFSRALQQYRVVMQGHHTTLHRYSLALAFYHLGRTSDALQMLDDTIAEQPYYNGYRYGLRALILFENGERERAERDLEWLSKNTWREGGLNAYVHALMAIEDGDHERAVDLLKFAEATVEWKSGFIPRLRRELAQMGETPLENLPDRSTQATPIPESVADGHVGNTPPPLRYVPLMKGTGQLELAPYVVVDLHFVPPVEMRIQKVIKLSVHLVRGSTPELINLEIRVFNNAIRSWHSYGWLTLNPEWGLNPVADTRCASIVGDVYLRVRNKGDTTLTLGNLGLHLEIQTPEGEIMTYSIEE
jgi:tetratricopeptide (TPR) repeat protein